MTNTPEIFSLKEQLADDYIKSFTKELNVLQKAGVMLVEKKMKQLLLQQEELPQTIHKITLTKLEETLISLAPETANKVFAFLQEKQKLLLIADTKDKLEQLKNGVIPTQIPPTADAAQAAWSSDKSSETVNTTTTNVETIQKDQQKNNTWHTAQHLVSGSWSATKYWVMWWWLAAEVWQHIVRDWMKIKWNTYIEWSILKKWEKFAEAMNEGQVKKWLTEITDVLRARVAWGGLLQKQINAINKTIKNIEAAAQSTDSMAELGVWKKLVKEWKLSAHIFGKMKPEAIATLAKNISVFTKDAALMQDVASIATKGDLQAMKTLMESKWVVWLSDEIVQTLVATKWDTKAIESIVSVFAKWDKITKLAHVTRALPFLDLAFYGVEVWDFATNEEAEKIANIARRENEKNRQITHLAIDTVGMWVPAALATGAALYGLYTWLAASWPAWWIVLGWVAAAEWVKYWADKLYFDVQDFYKQNKTDFVTQSLSQIKQAIIQADYKGLDKNLSWNDSIWWVSVPESINTAKEAFWAAIFLQENENNAYNLIAKKIQLDAIAPTVQELSPDQQAIYTNECKTLEAQKKELQEQQKKLEQTIKERMQYISFYLPWWTKSDEFEQAIHSSKSMEYVDTLLAKSKVYQEAIHDKEFNKNTVSFSSPEIVQQYIFTEREILKKENNNLYEKLFTLYKKSPTEYAEIVKNIMIYKTTVAHDDEYAPLAATIDFVEKFDHVLFLWVPKKNQATLSSIGHTHYVNTDTMIKNMAQWKDIVLPPVAYTQSQIKVKFTKWWTDTQGDSQRFVEIQQYSDNLGQNILYRMAEQFHGYAWPNTMQALQQFYAKSEDGKKDNALGIYFDAEDQVWKMNNDYAKDQVLNLQDLEKKSVDQIMTDWCKEIPHWQTMLAWAIIPWWVVIAQNVLSKSATKDMIDTATESTDASLNKEFLTKLQHIISTEKQAESPEQQKKVQEEILTYIKQYAWSGYVELPYSLLQKSARAWFGQLQYFYFTIWTDGKIYAMSRHEYVGKPLHIPWVVRQYVDEKSAALWWNISFDQIDWNKVGVVTLDSKSEWWVAINETQKMIQEIQKTAWELKRQWRWEVLYNPVDKTIQSRWKKTKIEYKNGKRIVADGKLKITYTSLREAAKIANICNWFAGKYKPEHKEMELEYGSMWVREWIFDVNTGFWWFDTALISWKTIEKDFKESFANDATTKTLIDYLQKI